MPEHSRHIRQLDGLRALAVGCVLFHHFVTERLALGGFGVILFFVISGFLITGILLRARETVSSGLISFPQALKLFYCRRSLRIFPLYYLVLAVWFAMNTPNVRSYIVWNASYPTNFLVALHPNEVLATAHFWTLAVEEQFYLLWPLVILCVPIRFLRPVMWGIVLTSSTFRAVAKLVLHWDQVTVTALTISCLDALALGGLLAVGNKRDASLVRTYGPYCGGLAAALCVLTLFHLGTKLKWLSFELLCAVAAASLVSYATSGLKNHFGTLLQWKPLAYCGAISYGIYVYHIPVYWQTGRRPILSSVLTIAIAAASWHLFEKPINSLKRHFEYPRTNTQPLPGTNAISSPPPSLAAAQLVES